jgi:hypothetical protein
MMNMSDKRTRNALIGRGLPSDLVNALCAGGFTVAHLQSANDEALINAGIPRDFWEAIRDGSRPPIPQENVIQLTYECASCCCVCRQQKPYVIHHIKPWAESRDHSIDNLVVLCLDCHGRAHTKSEISFNLTPDLIRKHKQLWIEEVRAKSKEIALKNNYPKINHATWDYFNHVRLLEIAERSGVDFRMLHKYEYLVKNDVINSEGWIKKFSVAGARFLYEGIPYHHATALRFYYTDIADKILSVCRWNDVTNEWDRISMRALAQQGTLVVCRGRYCFQRKKQQRGTIGVEQERRGYLKKAGIMIDFLLNPYEATSSSAYGGILSGQNLMTALLWVKDIGGPTPEHDGVLVVNARCLALGHGFGTPPEPRRWEYLQFVVDDDIDIDSEEEPEGQK